MPLAETELQDDAKTPLGMDEFVKRRQEQRAASSDDDAGEAPPGEPGPDTAPEGAPEADQGAVDHEGAAADAPGSEQAPETQEPGPEAPDKPIGRNVHAETDQALARAWQDLQVRAGHPPYSEAELDRIAEEESSDTWMKATHANRKHKSEIETEAAELRGKIKTRQKERQTQFTSDLATLIPNWSKPEVRRQEGERLSAYLSSIGFSEAEQNQLAGFMDARLVKMARNSMKYEEALERERARRKDAAGKKGVATTDTPGGSTRKGQANVTTTLEAAQKRYAKNPTADNFAAVRAIKRKQQGAA